MRIKTYFDQPPIPTRSFDWQAVDDDTYDGAPDSKTRNQIGHGATEVGDPGAQTVASGAPEYFAETAEDKTSATQGQDADSGNGADAAGSAPVFDEEMALVLDEGQNSSNAWRLHNLMRREERGF